MTGGARDKSLTTQALGWFDGVKDRAFSWVFDAEQGYKHTMAITCFVLGALLAYLAPGAP